MLLLAKDDEVLITQYGVLGDSDAIDFSADIDSGVVSLSGTTTAAMDVSLYKFSLS